MSSRSIRSKQNWAWLAVAMSAPLAHFSGGSWPVLILLGVVCIALTQLLPDMQGQIRENKLLCGVELVWIILLLSQWMPMSAAYWPGEYSEWVVPGILLALGAYSCAKRPARVAGVLFWILVLMYVPVLFAGVKDIKLQWLLPEKMELDWWMVTVLLLPALLKWDGVRENDGRWILFFGGFLWMITSGVLSPAIAGTVEVPFRELSRSLTIGAASRFESLVSVAITFGWCGLSSFLLRTGGSLLETLGIRRPLGSWLIGVAAFVLIVWEVRISSKLAAMITVLLWLLLPAFEIKKQTGKMKKAVDKWRQ